MKTKGGTTVLSRQKKAILLSVCAIAVLGIAYLILSMTLLKDTSTPAETVDKFGETIGAGGKHTMFQQIERKNIKEIIVTNSKGKYRYYRGDDGKLYIDGAEAVSYDPELISNLVVSCGYPLSLKLLDDPKPYEDYKLTADTCLATFEITALDTGKHYKVYIGMKLLTEGGYYARLDGRDAVYVLDTTLEKSVFADIKDYFVAQLAPNIDQNYYYNITDFLLKKNGEEFVNIIHISDEEKEAEALTTGQKMIYPGNFVPSSYNYSTVILQHFITLVGESVEEYGINKYLTAQTSDEKTKFIEILNKYGFLDENGKFLYELSYSYDNVSTTLYVSKLDENNYYHIYSPRYDIIASMPKDSFSWIEWDLIKYVDSGIFSMNINNVKRIEFTSPSANASFDLSYINEGKKDDLTVMCEQSGKRVTTTNFREFYKQMLYVANAGYADSDNGEAASAQLKIITVDDIVRTYTFYDISSLRSYYTVDGNGNFYVSRSYVKKLIEDISLLLKDDFDVPAGSPDKIVVASRNDF